METPEKGVFRDIGDHKKGRKKMIRIKASYSNMRELEKMVKVLKPYIANYIVKPQKGKYKRVYIDIDVDK